MSCPTLGWTMLGWVACALYRSTLRTLANIEMRRLQQHVHTNQYKIDQVALLADHSDESEETWHFRQETRRKASKDDECNQFSPDHQPSLDENPLTNDRAAKRPEAGS